MTLRQKQCLFADAQARLIVWIRSMGWAVTLGEGFDDDSEGHMSGSLHYIRLAMDLNLFVDGTWNGDVFERGKYVSDGSHPAWKSIGEKWESLHPLCRWGGHFNDANHISIAHEGKA